MKKRNMAITIAAVTAATSVAPALSFADTLNNKVIASNDEKAVAQLKGEIEKLLNTKYTDDKDLIATGGGFNVATAGACVYNITYTVGSSTDEKTISNMDDLNVALAKLNDKNNCLNITVVDNGHNTVNGQVVNWKEGKYTQDEITQVLNTASAAVINTTEEVNTVKENVEEVQTKIDTAITAAGKDVPEALTNAKASIEKAIADLPTGNTTTNIKPENVVAARTALKEIKTDVEDVTKATNLAIASLTSEFITDTSRFNDDAVELTLKNNKTPLLVKTGDVELNLDAPIYSQKGYAYLDKDGKQVEGVTNDEQAAESDETVVTGFKAKREVLVKVATEQTKSDYEETQTFGVDYESSKTTDYKATQLFDNTIGRLTPQGNQLKQFIEEYNNTTDVGVDASISNVADGKLTISFPVDKTEAMKNNAAAKTATGAYAQVVVTGTTSELNGLKDALNGKSKINVLAGLDRFNTAVQVSEATFKTKDATKNPVGDTRLEAKEVVLVSGYVLADGLTATPFAAAKQAPVLLTTKEKIAKDTMDEIERVLGTTGTVNVIGGENTINKSVETQLVAAGYKVNRISGDDRCETSLEIAKAMEAKLNGNVYIAGGYAEADSMSIAPIAARGIDENRGTNAKNTTPIILADQKSGLSKDAIKYIGDVLPGASAQKTTEVKPYIIGGADKAPEVIKTQLSDIKVEAANASIANAKRLSGDNREATNAAVIKEFATKGDLANLYVAKSDNQGLVDSLSAGVLAGSKNAPILLATKSVSAEQQSVLKAINPTVTNKTQFGEGIAAQVWSTINDLFKK